jgi:hypothetical protein
VKSIFLGKLFLQIAVRFTDTKRTQKSGIDDVVWNYAIVDSVTYRFQKGRMRSTPSLATIFSNT